MYPAFGQYWSLKFGGGKMFPLRTASGQFASKKFKKCIDFILQELKLNSNLEF